MNSYNSWIILKASTRCSSAGVSTWSLKSPLILKFLTRKFNTSQKKGKLSVIKKIDRPQYGVEILKSQSASSFIKKLNWENKHLFGEIITSVKRTCEKLTYNHRKKFCKTIVPTTYPEPCIPIQDVKSPSPPSLAKDDILKTDSATQLHSCVLDSILNFPLMDQLNTKDVEEKTNELNYLRQCLETICNGKKFPSITSVLEKTMPPERKVFLEKWKLSMIEQMGEEGFAKFQKEMLFNGSSLHQSIRGYFSESPEMQTEVRPGNAGHWNSLKEILPLVKKVKLLEEHITHPLLCYKGVVDCLGTFRDNFVVVDWKTSKKPKLSLNSTYDSPLQIAAYVGALNFDPRFKYMVNKGLIVIAYENGMPGTVHYMNKVLLENYWQKWLLRLKSYWESQRS